MVHAQGGLYFEKGADGSVVLIVKNDDAENAATIKDVTIPREVWDDIVAEAEEIVADAEADAEEAVAEAEEDVAEPEAVAPPKKPMHPHKPKGRRR